MIGIQGVSYCCCKSLGAGGGRLQLQRQPSGGDPRPSGPPQHPTCLKSGMIIEQSSFFSNCTYLVLLDVCASYHGLFCSGVWCFPPTCSCPKTQQTPMYSSAHVLLAANLPSAAATIEGSAPACLITILQCRSSTASWTAARSGMAPSPSAGSWASA